MEVVVVIVVDEVFGVYGLYGFEDFLYFFGVVYVVGWILVVFEDFDGFVVRVSNKFFIGRWEFNIYYSCDVFFVDVLSFVEVFGIEYVDIMVFWGYS